MGGWRLIVLGVALTGLIVCPSLLGAPAPGLPAGDRATFDVIVEGTGSASRNVSLDGQLGTCFVSSRTSSTEGYEYGRGRGLRVEFVRLGTGRRSVVIMRRVGRPMFAPVAFNVRATVTNEASGQAERSGPTGICMSAIEAVGDEDLCGQRPGRENYSLAYLNRKLSLGVHGDPLPPLPSPKLCGVNGIETASGPPPDGFHTPADLRSKRLAPSRIFGSVRRFKVELESGDVVSRQDSPIPGLSGAAVNRASHRAVVRFIRVGS
jgi:hypothetical protein